MLVYIGDGIGLYKLLFLSSNMKFVSDVLDLVVVVVACLFKVVIDVWLYKY